MDSTTFRILDALSRSLGKRYSINGLVKRMQELGYTAYYKNVYDRVQELRGEGILEVSKTGNASLVSLRLGNPQTIDELSVLELEKKRRLLEKHADEEFFIRELESAGKDIISLSLIEPEENIKLNAAEILCLAESSSAESILKKFKELAGKHNRRLCPLVLSNEEFKFLLEARGYNSVKGILADKVVLTNPSGFWKTISEAGIREESLHKMSEPELYYNLSRFGYTAFTIEEKGKAEEYGIESTITACLMKDDARLTEAVLILLAKNTVNFRLLLYLTLKYNKTNMMGYLIEAAKTLIKDEKKKKNLDAALKLFELFCKPAETAESANPMAKKWGVETRTALSDLEETMRLYNAV